MTKAEIIWNVALPVALIVVAVVGCQISGNPLLPELIGAGVWWVLIKCAVPA